MIAVTSSDNCLDEGEGTVEEVRNKNNTFDSSLIEA